MGTENLNIIATAYGQNLKLFFEAHAVPSQAGPMEKYMKNRFRFLGIKSPQRKELLREFLKNEGLPDAENIEDTVKYLWQAGARELHYAAMELLARKKYLHDKKRIALIEWIIVNQSWWDTVDYIASNIAGLWLSLHPEEIGTLTTKWMKSENIWLQRTCLLFQLKYKQRTDFNLLKGFIEELSGEKEFFIRKAIGWALREYAKASPETVIQFVENNSLSPLSRKEALKNLKK